MMTYTLHRVHDFIDNLLLVDIFFTQLKVVCTCHLLFSGNKNQTFMRSCLGVPEFNFRYHSWSRNKVVW